LPCAAAPGCRPGHGLRRPLSNNGAIRQAAQPQSLPNRTPGLTYRGWPQENDPLRAARLAGVCPFTCGTPGAGCEADSRSAPGWAVAGLLVAAGATAGTAGPVCALVPAPGAGAAQTNLR